MKLLMSNLTQRPFDHIIRAAGILQSCKDKRYIGAINVLTKYIEDSVAVFVSTQSCINFLGSGEPVTDRITSALERKHE